MNLARIDQRLGIVCALSLVVSSHMAPNAEARTVVFKVESKNPSSALGQSVEVLGDIDGDGVPDFAVSGREDDTGFVRTFSGIDGTELYTITSAFPNTSYGENRNLAAVGDLGGDRAGWRTPTFSGTHPSIDFQRAQAEVTRLQVRIAKALKESKRK